MLQELYAALAVLLSLGMCVGILYFMLAGRHDRDEEEAAREFFTAHGHWPDETPGHTPSES